jgi:hypothetical protein
MPNFSFIACLEVEILWLETTNKKRQKTRQDSVELEATLAWAEVSAGAVAKADQNTKYGLKY